MAIPKAVSKLINSSNEYKILEIEFRSNYGLRKAKGYVIIDNDKNELLRIAPTQHGYPKWIVFDRMNNIQHNIQILTELSKIKIELRSGKTNKVFEYGKVRRMIR